MTETDRLHLIPLTADQLKLWIEDISALEKELNCTYCAEPIEGIFLDIIKGQFKITLEDETNYFFHSFWFLVRKSDRIVVGSADFKGLPNTGGEVEIGYGLGKEFEHNGYMTEAVSAMCDWALRQPSVTKVIAETEKENIPSQRVLKKCNMKMFKETENCFWWELTKSSASYK